MDRLKQIQVSVGRYTIHIGEEVSEKLTIIPARFIVTRYIQPTYACHHCEGSGDEDNPAMPPAIINRGISVWGGVQRTLTSLLRCDVEMKIERSRV